MHKLITYLVVALIAVSCASYPVQRSNKARLDFARQTTCPSTGANKLPCPGYIIDHIEPLCAGGADTPANMQWQTVADANAKDRIEKAECRALRNAH